MTKVVILAGGFGTRLSEETVQKPKPMVEIGGMPILWHIMKFYHAQGLKEFVICAGYKQYVIKEFFANYRLHSSDVTFDGSNGTVLTGKSKMEDWKVTIVDTGENTLTGGRIKRIKPYLNNQTFCLTYGDGLSDIDVRASMQFHKKMGKAITISAVFPPARFGELEIEGGLITHFQEKRPQSERRINGGFMVVEPSFIDWIDGDHTVLEQEPMKRAAAEKQMAAYCHDGFWQCMDRVNDKQTLEKLWADGQAPWRIWDTKDSDGRKILAA